MKVILCLALGLVVLSGGAWLWGSKTNASRQQIAADLQRVRNEGLVRDRYRKEIDRAKAHGQNEVVLPGATGIPTTVNSIERIMRNHSLLRVKVIDKETTVSESDARMKTWYKVEIVETLHQQDKIDDKPLFDGVPSRFLPLLPSESLLIVQGGEITVDGVRIIRMVSDYEVDYILNEEYLIASHLDYGGKVIFPIAQAPGVFRVENTNLKPLGHKQHKLVREMEEMYGNDVDRFRSDIELRRQMREK